MRVEVLVSSLNKNPKRLISDMNITGDAIIVNQCDKNDYEEIKTKKGIAKVYYFNERGIGLSRNSAIMRATADIVLFADDDEVLINDYEDKIIDEFEQNKNADIIVFDFDKKNCNRKVADISKRQKLNKFNSLRYGAARLACKLEKIRRRNILFSLLFGGGAKYGSGEDSLFIFDSLNKKLKLYTSPIKIATVDFKESSWFKGYDEKFFYDKGALFYSLYGKFYSLFSVAFIFKHKKDYEVSSIFRAYKNMRAGAKSIR